MKKTVLSLFLLSSVLLSAQESSEISRFRDRTDAVISQNKSTLSPNFIRFKKPELLNLMSADPKAKAQEFISKNAAIYGPQAAEELVFSREFTDNYGLKNVEYRQVYHGIPVFDGVLKFHF